MSLIQIVYYSRKRASAQDGSSLQTLRSILSVSQRNNARDGITGFLIFDHAWFVQILEGERAPVVATFERLSRDERHSGLTQMSLREVRVRSFPRWSMAGALRTIDQTEIYLRHGIGERMDPTRLTAPTVLALAMDLQDDDAARRSGLRAAS